MKLSKIDKAINLMKEEMKKEFGEDSKLEDGDSIVGIFKDCAIKIENCDNKIELDVTIGEPYIFDFNVFEEAE